MRREAVLPALALAATMATPMPSAAADTGSEWTLVTALDGDDLYGATHLPVHPAPSGLALAGVDGLWHLVPATLTGSFRARDDQNTVRLSATPADALVYLRVPGLVVGKIDAADMRFKGTPHEFDKPVLPVPFKGTTWRFEAKAGKLSLTDGARRQQLGLASDESDMRTVRLLWAGDIDRDGKLDFLIDFSSDDSGEECLWLSSRAKAGEFAGKAACMGRGD